MKIRSKLFALAVVVLLGAPWALGQAADWRQIHKPVLRPFHPQQPRRLVLASGVVIFLQEDHELPLVGGIVRVRGGSREEPAAKVGLVDIYGQAWRTGGTKKKTGDELDDYLEARGAKVETAGDLDSTTISWDCLKESLDEVFPVLLELLRKPEFREEKIVLAKNQLNTQIARRNDNPLQIAGREAVRLGYGGDSPYARVAEYATVAAVTRQDLLNWHRTYLHPNNIILGVAGDFDSRAMEQKLRRAFSSWPKGPAAKRAEVAFPGPRPGIYFIQKDDVNQSNIAMVHLGTTRDNPDYYAIEVFNEFFGGGFASRLFSNIRSKKGLAYAVGGGVGTAFDHPGLFQIRMGTKSGSTAAAIDALYEELDNLEKSPATPEELGRAKEALLNSFIFRFDSREKVLRERMTYEFYGYPADFLEKYRAGIEKVRAEGVARAVRRYIHRDRLALLVVGKASDFDRPLSSFGSVQPIDITIPEGASARKEAGGGNAEGKALLARVIEALGGEAKLRSIKAVRKKASVTAKTPQGEMALSVESIQLYPDRIWQKMGTPVGEMTMSVSPEAAFMTAPMGTRDLPSSQRESLLREIKRDPIFIALHKDDPKFGFQAAGSQKVGEVEARILDVNADGAEVRWLVDPISGRILRSVARVSGMGGPAEQVVDYSDWKAVEGVSVAFKQKITRGGEDAGSAELQEFEVNPKLDPKIFEKPAEK